MRTVNVVVIGVLSQHRLQLSASEDEHPVQHLPPNGPDPSLRVGIRPWRPHRSAQHLDPFSGKHCIERRGELRIPIADQEPEAADTIVKGHEQIPGLLGYPHPRRLRGHTKHVDPPGRDLDHEQHIQAFEEHRVHGEEVHRQHAIGLARRNCRHETVDRLGAGSTPARCRMHHTVLAPIL
jgi:hypothetical protein